MSFGVGRAIRKTARLDGDVRRDLPAGCPRVLVRAVLACDNCSSHKPAPHQHPQIRGASDSPWGVTQLRPDQIRWATLTEFHRHLSKRWLIAQDWYFGDDDDYLAEELEVYDDDYELIGTESRREKWLRIGGQIWDDSNDYSDAYYGITHYGWEEIKEVTEEEIKVLRACGVLTEAEGA